MLQTDLGQLPASTMNSQAEGGFVGVLASLCKV
jgi:hypothetical protein